MDYKLHEKSNDFHEYVLPLQMQKNHLLSSFYRDFIRIARLIANR